MKKVSLSFLFIIASLAVFSQSNSSACKPNKVVQDKITKEKSEMWFTKLASSSSFKSSSTGKSDLLYHIVFLKSANQHVISLELSQTSSFTKEAFGDDLRFSNQDKIVFGWENNKPVEIKVESIDKSKKVLEKANQVINYYSLYFSVTEENFEAMKNLFANDLITGVRIVMANGTVIDKEVKGMNTKVQAKAKCFFSQIKR